MKKLVLPLLFLLAVGMLLAVESAPSAVVGYFKKTVATDSYDAFSVPFGYINGTVQDIIGDQLGMEDYILDLNTGLTTTYYGPVDGWFGDFDVMVPGHAYLLYRNPANPVVDYYLLGKVDPQPVELTINETGTGWTPIALNEASPVLLADINLQNLTEEDFLIDMQTGLVATYYNDYGWYNAEELFTSIDPTHTYWLYVAHPDPFVWSYSPVRGVSDNSIIHINTRRKK